MKFADLLEIVAKEPVFDTGLLLAGAVDRPGIWCQLSRWVADGRLHQLRRGLYALAPPFQKTVPHPFVVANRLVGGSYVSLQSALAHHNLIPESVPVVTSVTSRRPQRFETPLGVFDFRHVQKSLLGGFERIEVGRPGEGQLALVAAPAKALADLIYLTPDADTRGYLEELRLEGLTKVGVPVLRRALAGRRKLRRAFKHLESLAVAEEEYQRL